MPSPAEFLAILQELNKLVENLKSINFNGAGLDMPSLLALFRKA